MNDGRVKKIKKLYDYPLRVKGKDISIYEIVHHKCQQIIADLKETLMTNKNGVGLSSHQIGLPYKIFIAVDEVFVNPSVISVSDETVESREGCLSLPNAVRTITRHKEIEIKYMTEEGDFATKNFTGLKAIVIQHELDHLEGKLISDNR